MSLPNYLAKIKSSGMYRYVFDKSAVPSQDAETLRLVVGYSEKGPFNTPVYIDNVADFKTIFGGISKKLERKGYELTADNVLRHVHDVVGLRIVCSFVSDVYDIINIIKSSRHFVVKNESDYIKNPKNSGYTSYHINILVPVHLEDKTEYIEAEIQIRTVAMDCWASLDHKLRYKLNSISDELENGMLQCADKMIEIDKQMQQLCELVRKERNNNKEEVL